MSARAPDDRQGDAGGDGLVALGHIAGAHGIRGEVVIKSYTAAAEAIAGYGPLRERDGARTFQLRRVRPTGKGLVATIAGVTDRNAAEALRGVVLCVPRASLPEPDEEEWYHADLIGLRVVGPDGEPLGVVAAIHDFGAGDLLEVRPQGRGETALVAFTRSAVPLVDVAGGRLVLADPALLEASGPAPPEATGEAEGLGSAPPAGPTKANSNRGRGADRKPRAPAGKDGS
ncbi:MAG: 16S rRNA processing protein RimM [Rhizobiales bacterium]|nr:16S rRNA processing protein RimM [Hyphomicrobiales bacterium]